MPILSDSDKKYIREKFEKELVREVPIVFLKSENCEFCPPTEEFLKELAELSENKLKLTIQEMTNFHAQILGVNRGPVIVMGNHGEIRYTGAPIGEESWGFLEAILLLSNRKHGLEKYEEHLQSLDKKVKIETIVTPTCPWCPHAAVLAHKIAVASNGKVISDVIEAYEFPEIADKFGVTGVPTVVLSVGGNYTGKVFWVGVPELHALIRAVIKLGIEE